MGDANADATVALGGAGAVSAVDGTGALVGAGAFVSVAVPWP